VVWLASTGRVGGQFTFYFSNGHFPYKKKKKKKKKQKGKRGGEEKR